MDKKMNSKHGFTLAEILITLTVIGVVAALTIPTLLQNTQQAELKTALKRNFADLSQATNLIKNDLGGSFVGAFPGNYGSSEALKNAYKGKLSYIKDCSADPVYGGTGSGASPEGCWHGQYEWQWLGGSKRLLNVEPGLILNNGTLIIFYNKNTQCSEPTEPAGDITYCGFMYFDVNGFKKPNTIGKDIFEVFVTNDGLIPSGARGDSPPSDPYYGCLPTSVLGLGCTAKYLYE